MCSEHKSVEVCQNYAKWSRHFEDMSSKTFLGHPVCIDGKLKSILIFIRHFW